MKILIDENLPYSTKFVLNELEHDVIDVKDTNLRGEEDKRIFAFAQSEERIFITRDMDFANILKYPPGTHGGIIILRLPMERCVEEINEVIREFFQEITEEKIKGAIIIIEEGKYRIRR